MTSRRRLTVDQVRDARRRWRAGETGMALAREFGMGRQNMMAAIKGLSYCDIPGGVPDAETRARMGGRRS